MSILIKGMWTTKDGCVDIRIWGNGTVEILRGYNRFIVDGAKAVELPLHGRLGDLDKLETGLRNMAKYQVGERRQGILGCCETIRLTPTIIEAEEEET